MFQLFFFLLRFLAIILIFIIPASQLFASSEQLIISTSEFEKHDLRSYLELLEDSKREFKIEQVASQNFSDKFISSTVLSPSLAPSYSAWWIRFTIHNSQNIQLEQFLEWGTPRFDTFHLFEERADGSFKTRNISAHTALNSREIPSTMPTMRVVLPPNKAVTFYLRLTSIEPITLTLAIWDINRYLQHNRVRFLIKDLSLGILLVMLIYHLFYWMVLKGSDHIWYIMTLISVLVFVLYRDGVILDILPDYSIDTIVMAIPLAYVVILCNVFFILSFVDAKHTQPKLNRFVLLAMLPLMLSFIAPFYPRDQIWQIYSFIIAYTSINIFPIYIVVIRAFFWNNSLDIKFLLAGQLVIFVAGALEILSGFGLIAKTVFMENILIVSFALLALFWAMALAQRIKLVREEKEAAQKAMLEHLEQVGRLKDIFLMNTSKELKEPLNGILSLTEKLEQDIPEDFKKQLNLISASGQQLSATIDEILESDVLPETKVSAPEHLRTIAVESLRHALFCWETHLGKNKRELAEISGLWTVNLESRGVFRTRNLDQYLDFKKLPANPKWHKIIQTLHFVQLQLPPEHPDHNELGKLSNQLVEQLRSIEKSGDNQ